MPTRRSAPDHGHEHEHEHEHAHWHGGCGCGHRGGYLWGVLTGIVLSFAAYGAVRMFCCPPCGMGPGMCHWAPPPMGAPMTPPHK